MTATLTTKRAMGTHKISLKLCMVGIFFLGGLFVFIPISYELPTGAAPLSLSDLWVADVKPLSPCPLSQLLRVTLLRIKYLLT